MSYIPLILAGFAASTVVSLALIPLQAIVTPANHSVTEVAFNSSNPTSKSVLSSTSAYVPSVSASNHSSESLAYAYYQCDAKKFGHPKFNSCREALHQMPNGWGFSTYGDRTVFGGSVDFPMPIRYASIDGACIIEVFAAKQGAIDRLEPSDLKMRVRYLLDKCVRDEEREGGIAEYLGENRRLSVFVKQSTTQFKCFVPMGLSPIGSACQLPLNTMPVSNSLELFGERGTQGIDVGLPLRYTDPRDECAIDVVIEGPPIRADWYDLWGAAAIVVAVCARRGKDGVFAKTVGETELAVWVSGGNSLPMPENTA